MPNSGNAACINSLFVRLIPMHTNDMNSVPLSLLAAVFWVNFAALGDCQAQTTMKKEINVDFADLEQVRPILKKALSPAGKFVLLQNKGSVMVIDTPTGILAAEEALAQAEFPVPDVALDFKFVTGLPSRKTSITMARELPLPVEYEAPTIIVGQNGGFTVVPATPTKFETRNIGVTSESTSTVNPDGSITLDTTTESTSFDGFINYGSAILPSGGIGTVPVSNGVANPTFFNPFINSGQIRMPIISTTRISTSIVIRPRFSAGVVTLDMMPRLTVTADEAAGGGEYVTDLKQYRTEMGIQNGQEGRVYGFTGADDEFHRHFFDAKDPDKGTVAIRVGAKAKPSVK